jgi:hypothetical protein
MADVLIRVKRPEGYEDVHADLVVEDMGIHPGFEIVSVSDVESAQAAAVVDSIEGKAEDTDVTMRERL